MGVKYSAVSHAVARMKKRIREGKGLEERTRNAVFNTLMFPDIECVGEKTQSGECEPGPFFWYRYKYLFLLLFTILADQRRARLPETRSHHGPCQIIQNVLVLKPQRLYHRQYSLHEPTT